MWVTNRSNMDMTDWNNSLKKNNCSLGNMDKIPCFDMGSFGYTPHNCKQENMDSQDNHNWCTRDLSIHSYYRSIEPL